MSSKHRINFDLSSPIRYLGMTVDEWIILILAISMPFLVPDKVIGLLAFAILSFVLFFLKKIKKGLSGFRLWSWVEWHFGYQKGDSILPPTSSRRYN